MPIEAFVPLRSFNPVATPTANRSAAPSELLIGSPQARTYPEAQIATYCDYNFV